jgi:hypothetical protein
MKKFIATTFIVVLLTGCFGGADPDRVPKTDEPTSKPVAELACNEGMSEYKVKDTTMEFCYDPAWGEPVISEMPGVGDAGVGDAGTRMHLTFKDVENGIELWYETKDYAAPAGTERFDIGSLFLIGTDDQIKEQVIEELSLSPEVEIAVRKSDIGGKRAARVNYSGVITYYVPEAFGNYHLTISAPEEMAVEVDEFVYDMVLN